MEQVEENLFDIYTRLSKSKSKGKITFYNDMRKKKDNLIVTFCLVDTSFMLSKDSKIKYETLIVTKDTPIIDIFYKELCYLTYCGKRHVTVNRVKNLLLKLKPDIERLLKIEKLLEEDAATTGTQKPAVTLAAA